MNSDLYTLASFTEAEEGHALFAKTRPFFEYYSDFRAKGYLQYRRVAASGMDARAMIEDPVTGKLREYVMLGSSNYLGLATHPRVIEAAVQATRRYGTSSAGAALLCGTSMIHRELEERLAAFERREDAIIFPTGYATNIGAVSALARRGDVIAFDRLAHASVIDGCRLAEAEARPFRHNSAEHLDAVLSEKAESAHGRLVVVDGVYSMDGDLARLPEICAVAKKHDACVMVDEAHGTGVAGPTGRGAVEHFGLADSVQLIVGTLSKSLASQGGFVAASREVVTYIRFYARSYFFSTSPPPAQMAAALEALKLIDEERWRLERLWENVTYLRDGLMRVGFDCLDSRSAIIPVMIGDELTTRRMGRRLNELGIFVNPVPYPAVPKNKTRLRLSAIATHERADLDRAIEALETAGREHGLL